MEVTLIGSILSEGSAVNKSLPLHTKPTAHPIFAFLKFLKTRFWEGQIYLESLTVFEKIVAGLDEITEII